MKCFRAAQCKTKSKGKGLVMSNEKLPISEALKCKKKLNFWNNIPPVYCDPFYLKKTFWSYNSFCNTAFIESF